MSGIWMLTILDKKRLIRLIALRMIYFLYYPRHFWLIAAPNQICGYTTAIRYGGIFFKKCNM
jgi:hypothetical protein